ncbi:MAG TPA: hypothetical protein VGJ81_06010 [Thermoanaerobaculia bacterium]|jgi:hypothetical protein
MAIGGNWRAAGETFAGLVDEVRIFTFVPVTFSVSDLNYELPPPPQQVAESIEGQVVQLISQTSLPAGQATALTSKRQAAIDNINAGDATSAINNLNALRNQLNAMIPHRLTDAEAEPLIQQCPHCAAKRLNDPEDGRLPQAAAGHLQCVNAR